MNKNITIDGPAGSGKSTIAKLLSKRLGLIYIDTGAMFRAIALYMLEKGISSEDISEVKKGLASIKLDIIYENDEQQIILNGKNVNLEIRKPEISKLASRFATIPEVRTKLLKLQRELATQTAVVMDGRDIGTKVLPDASTKIFLTADVNVRAERRYRELLEKGEKVTFEDIIADIKDRDKRDSTRKVAPLTKAEDAVVVDTSALSIDEVVSHIIKISNKNSAFNTDY